MLQTNGADISLEPLTVGDADFLVKLLNTPEYLKYIGDRGIRTSSQARDYIDQYFLESYRQHGFGYYVVRDKRGACAGMVGLMQRNFLEHPDIGFAFLPDFYGSGLAQLSCSLLMDRAGEKHGLRKVNAFTDHKNIASQKLLKKLTFTYDGVFQHPETGEELQLYSAMLEKPY